MVLLSPGMLSDLWDSSLQQHGRQECRPPPDCTSPEPAVVSFQPDGALAAQMSDGFFPKRT